MQPIPRYSLFLFSLQFFFLFDGDHGDKLGAGIVKSRVRILMPLKTRCVEEWMHVNYVIALSPHVGFVWKLGEWSASSGVVLIG
ncbi:hypothetical protein TNCV_2148561 [Trichonephila clavipes]|uniref:Secreted protein n=1 Tax=Trichonephila clavipes TaxID=2585209 RepID=A0A8X6T6Y9_TRICX|nr:hypothetical protein TNCV_2148561 [Trichonephila clavipes]